MHRYGIYLVFAGIPGSEKSGRRVRAGDTATEDYALAIARDVVNGGDNGIETVEITRGPGDDVVHRIDRNTPVKRLA